MNILETIVARKKLEVASLDSTPVTLRQLQSLMRDRGEPRDFAAALRPSSPHSLALIAEVKKASPSAGIIRADFDPVKIARAYASGGANCLSVLTDREFFQGSLTYLQAIRQAVDLPLLRKDFIIDARQIREAIHWGADAILLIVAILEDAPLRELLDLASNAGLAVLVEVHDAIELERAVNAGARIIGINNRNLKTFTVDLSTTEHLAAMLCQMTGGQPRVLVAESGIHTHVDVAQVQRCGAHAILVGEALMRHHDIPAKIQELMSNLLVPISRAL